MEVLWHDGVERPGQNLLDKCQCGVTQEKAPGRSLVGVSAMHSMWFSKSVSGFMNLRETWQSRLVVCSPSSCLAWIPKSTPKRNSPVHTFYTNLSKGSTKTIPGSSLPCYLFLQGQLPRICNSSSCISV